MLQLIHHNRLEVLAEHFGQALQQCQRDPLQPLTCIVPQPSVARWLKIYLAERYGISAGVDYPLLGSFVNALSETADDAFWSAELSWQLFAILRSEAPLHPTLQQFLADRSERKQWQLAVRLADVFNDYQIYRRKLLAQWEQPRSDEHWQAGLWRQLLVRATTVPAAQRYNALLDELHTGERRVAGPIFVFGLTAIAPDYLAILRAIARSTPTTLLLPTISRHYIGDLISRRQQLQSAFDFEPANVSHPLVDDLAHPMQMLWRELATREATAIDDAADYVAPATSSLLAHVQRDIIELQVTKQWLPPDDSLTIHGCHSPLREVETLQQSLWQRFAEDDTLTARDVLVMVPRLAAYAPLIRGVFSRLAPDEPGYLPIKIVDRTPRDRSPLVQAFLQLVQVKREAITANQVVEWLSVRAIARARGLAHIDPAWLRAQINAANIAWGLDAEHRLDHIGLSFTQNSWQFGLDRLLMGFAAGDERLVDGLLTQPNIEGQAGIALGQLQAMINTLRTWYRFSQRTHQLAQWRDRLLRLVDEWLVIDPDDASERDAQVAIRAAIGTLARGDAALGQAPVELTTVVAALEASLGSNDSRATFPGAAITFCAPVPMRNLPYRFIAMLGMNQHALPSPDSFDQLNLIHQRPQAGDRIRRDDERLLFLQTIAAAGQYLHLSYVARSAREDKPLEPSVLIAQLQDFVEQNYLQAGSTLMQQHGLHAYSPSELRSFPVYSAADRAIAEAIARGPDKLDSLVQAAVAWTDAPELPKVIELEQLVCFLQDPPRVFLQLLGVYLFDDNDLLIDEEPLALDGLAGYFLRQRLLADDAIELTLERGRGALPMPPLDQTLLEEQRALAQQLHAAIHKFGPSEAAELAIDLDDVRIVGPAALTRDGDWILDRAGRIRDKDKVAGWVRHLCLQAGGHGCARMFGIDPYKQRVETHHFAPSSTAFAQTKLSAIVDWYRLAHRRVLVAAHPKSDSDYHALLGSQAGKSADQQHYDALLQAAPEND